MKVHHINCATMCPRGGKAFGGEGNLLARVELVCHTLVIESGNELVLVDTGLGTADVANRKSLPQPFRSVVNPTCKPEETAVRRLEGLGLDPKDVRHIVITHLDVDHAGGLPDFPEAEVHVFDEELAAALKPPLNERLRYHKAQWAHGPKWVEHAVEGDDWFGFESVRVLPGLDAEIALVPLRGHTTGHSGVALKQDGGWLLHCGDAYFHRGEIETPPTGPRGLEIFQTLIAYKNKVRRQNQERLRELARNHADDVRLISAHDPVEFEREQSAA